VSANTKAEALLRILDRLPSAPWSSRIDPGTMTSEWVYLSPRMAELCGMTEAEMHGGPLALLQRVAPEDAAQFQQLMAASLQTLAPMTWTGRVIHASGASRWIEMQVVHEREDDGMIRTFGQVVDVTERKQTEQMLRTVIDALPAGVVVSTPDGHLLIHNHVADEFIGSIPEVKGGDFAQAFGVLKTDGITPFPNEELPLVRAIGGEESEAEMIVHHHASGEDRCVHVTGTPIRDEASKAIAGLVVFHDITRLRSIEQELRTSNEHLAANEESKIVLIDQLRYSIHELSNPILEVWDDVLAMPIIGVVDARRTADMEQRLLVEVERTQARFVIIDLTGVEIVNTQTADHLMKLVREVELVGARCVLTGIHSAVAEALVNIGVDFGRLTTLRNLKHGLREALRQAQHEQEGMRPQPRRRDEREAASAGRLAEAPRKQRSNRTGTRTP